MMKEISKEEVRNGDLIEVVEDGTFITLEQQKDGTWNAVIDEWVYTDAESFNGTLLKYLDDWLETYNGNLKFHRIIE